MGTKVPETCRGTEQSLTNLPTARSPKENDNRTRCCKYTEVLLRMGKKVPETCRGTEQSLTNLPTARSPKETDIEPDVANIQRSS